MWGQPLLAAAGLLAGSLVAGSANTVPGRLPEVRISGAAQHYTL
jgi:hypothetical protein